MADYLARYDGYWQQPDRIGESSFEDPVPIARQLLQICGSGSMLDVGCGMGVLVRELLRQGVDAQGVDVSPTAVDYCNRHAPGRFISGSCLHLPFDDGSFDTVVSTNCLEHLAPIDVPAALAEMYRVSRQQVFLRVTTRAEQDDHWRLTVEKRDWWETIAFQSGFRKHSGYYRANPFEALEDDGNTVTIPLERIAGSALAKYSLQALHAERDLHMDMLRETGRRSDAHVHRYDFASRLVRPGDVVVDAACGLGYGSHLLASMTPAGRIVGIDLSEYAIDYAKCNFGAGSRRVEFHCSDASKLSFLGDASVDQFVCFETLEHVPEPEALLAEAARVLKPGGRLIVSVPNNWADETGKDPSPWHLHVYDWTRLRQQLSRHFIVEQGCGETAGGGMRLPGNPRDFFTFAGSESPHRDSEWLLAVAMRDPLAGEGVPYRDTMYPDAEAPANLIEFARDYVNPHLVHALVSLPWRIREKVLLADLARRVRDRYEVTTSDHAAAVCVLAYQELDNPALTAEGAREAIGRIWKICNANAVNPHYLRWQISNAYVAALLARKIGALDEATVWFKRCADYDCLRFSHTLATKTVSASYHAGMLLIAQGQAETAAHYFNRGIDAYFSMFAGGRNAWLGNKQRPFDFPYFELTEVAAAVTNCVDSLRALHNPAGLQVLQRLPVRNLQSLVDEQAKTWVKQQQYIRQLEKRLAAIALAARRRPLLSAIWLRLRGIWRRLVAPDRTY